MRLPAAAPFRRRIAKWLRKGLRIAPPLLLSAWIVRAFFGAQNFVVPAFGPVESHLPAYRQALLGDGAIGLVLVALWVVVWQATSVRKKTKQPGKWKVRARDF